MAGCDDTDSSVPFLNVCKDGHLIDSICLDCGDVFVFGRHSNCDVVLEHPSISRRHLEIQILHATREIVLTDMDSVHGTWVGGMQIGSHAPYIMNEGVEFKLGASSRIYKVQWLHRSLTPSTKEQSIVPEFVVSNNLVLRSSNDFSTNNSTSTETSQAIARMQPTATNDACSNNGKFNFDARQDDDRSTACCKHGSQSQIQGRGVSQAGIAVECFNEDMRLQSCNRQQQKGRLPPVAPRRMPFAPLPPNTASPTIQKKPKSVEKKATNAGENPISPDEKLRREGESRLRLRRCNSAPFPTVNRSVRFLQLPESIIESPNELNLDRRKQSYIPNLNIGSMAIEPLSGVHEEPSHILSNIMCNKQPILEDENAPPSRVKNMDITDVTRGSYQQATNQLLPPIPLDEELSADDYPSDKENQEPGMEGQCKRGRISDTLDVNRKPFQPLILSSRDFSKSASPSISSDSGQLGQGFLTKPLSKRSSVVQNLDYMIQRLKGMSRLQAHHEWHIIIDSTCLLDPKSFKSLKRLEGMKEVRVIIPQIVIRELDSMNFKDKGCTSPTAVLKWIEACMLKYPSWIHVQNSSESLPPGGLTPPASPHHAPSVCTSACGELLSPTRGDYVLNCAILFNNTVFDGQVALLTNDTVLKIRAMAEGLTCEAATSFCESLLNPYSERFLWIGSVAHRTTVYPASKRSYHGVMEPLARSGEEHVMGGSVVPAAKGMNSIINKHRAVEDLKNHCSQALGLKVVLSKCCA